MRQAATATADADGLVRFAAGVLGAHDSPALTVAAANNGNTELLLLDNVPRPRQEETPPLKARLVTDRGLYKEGDEVHVAGYLRSQDGAALALPPADSSGVACALESLIGTCVESTLCRCTGATAGAPRRPRWACTRAATARSR